MKDRGGLFPLRLSRCLSSPGFLSVIVPVCLGSKPTVYLVVGEQVSGLGGAGVGLGYLLRNAVFSFLTGWCQLALCSKFLDN